MLQSIVALSFVGSALAGTVLWDGRFTQSTVTNLENWSWSNQVGQYQYYIHGDGNMTDYVNVGSDYKNPADTSSEMGVKITIDDTSYWNDQTMRRTELIPQTDAAINEGKRWYHFSMKRTSTNPPGTGEEHQVCFFESHFTEMKYGLLSGASGTSDSHLRWEVSSSSEWNVTFEAGVWHNIAYEIDFDTSTVGFWHSTGANDLTEVISPVSATVSSDGADWHLGVLRLVPSCSSCSDTTDNDAEDWYFSGVYIESGSITKSVSGPSGSDSSSDSSSSIAASSSTVATSSAAVAANGASTQVQVAATSSALVQSTAAVSSVVASATSVAPATSTVIASSAVVAASSIASSAAPVLSTSAAIVQSSAAPSTLITKVSSSVPASSVAVSASATSGSASAADNTEVVGFLESFMKQYISEVQEDIINN
ncbi:MAG: hypothetical protein M1834_009399 [Cirrosporium novae-zelandiae]|nr:MAG: hypothetical protein M1834_009399 [Cirrosporium novae-zelandiae]